MRVCSHRESREMSLQGFHLCFERLEGGGVDGMCAVGMEGGGRAAGGQACVGEAGWGQEGGGGAV